MPQGLGHREQLLQFRYNPERLIRDRQGGYDAAYDAPRIPSRLPHLVPP